MVERESEGERAVGRESGRDRAGETERGYVGERVGERWRQIGIG